MPDPMTPNEATKKICPFMSGWGDNPHLDCVGDRCACWAWVDGEEGQRGPQTFFELPAGEEPAPEDGFYFAKRYQSGSKWAWSKIRIIGPRRGQCEACSPNVTVEAP